ncbi:MAG: hypothetical protein HOP33_05545 [Verrucomicrobia bacterium]|nr:hypothetical protein [Verrucomicrobiota bacterium]
MTYTIQIFYPGAGLFMNTNHESESLDELKILSSSDLFNGSRVRVVDESQWVMFEPPVRESTGDPSLSGIASMLGVPIVDSPEDFLRNDEDNDAS